MQAIDKKLSDLSEILLKGTLPLFETAPPTKTKFCNVLLGVYRVSYITLGAIRHLSLQEGMGSPALDLTRKVIEYGIAIEYMILKGKEKMAERFQQYCWVEIHNEIEFYKSIGQNTSDWSSNIQSQAEEAEKKYQALPMSLKKDRNWAGKDIDGMLQSLNNAGALDSFNFSRMSRAYVLGSRQNHPNPITVQDYLDGEEFWKSNETAYRQALCIAICMHIRLTNRYIDEARTENADAFQEQVDLAKKVLNEVENILTEIKN